ncbi:MAG: LytTR family DNA-binding domain-containing protein [Azoarcus sp.]|jgi:two-component system response regulator AlgR|nr:LytTR family DNA-binding domain-containing protein [Azoarcus sp.]
MNTASSPRPLRVLIVDDEAPARTRLRDLLDDIAGQKPTQLVGMAASGPEVLRLLDEITADVVLADISMPTMSGVELARLIRARANAPAVIFTTAHDEYALQAFDVAATDYLLKPVTAKRLTAALERIAPPLSHPVGNREAHFHVVEREHTLLLPVDDVLYLRAELKYVTARTARRDYLLTETLMQIEQAHPERFMRIHRSYLVARGVIAGVRRACEQDGDAHWEIMLHGTDEALPISRRQWPTVRQMLRL